MNQFMQSIQQFDGWLKMHPIVSGILLVWILTWKGLALWKAARKNDLAWFVAILIINLGGVLEILYFFIFSERKLWKKEKKTGEENKKTDVQ